MCNSVKVSVQRAWFHMAKENKQASLNQMAPLKQQQLKAAFGLKLVS